MAEPLLGVLGPEGTLSESVSEGLPAKRRDVPRFGGAYSVLLSPRGPQGLLIRPSCPRDLTGSWGAAGHLSSKVSSGGAGSGKVLLFLVCGGIKRSFDVLLVS